LQGSVFHVAQLRNVMIQSRSASSHPRTIECRSLYQFFGCYPKA
jgi:hypothetical protein